MANNDTDVNVNIGATNSAKSVLTSAISDFSNFWKSASGGSDAKTAASNMDNLASKLGISNKALLGVGIGAGLVVAGTVAIGASAVKAATGFQTLTEELVTGAGESQKNLDMVKSGILNISSATGDTASSLAQGMFLIESAGYHGAAGLNVMKVAAEGAKVGGADLTTTSDALTTVMHDYGISANNSAEAMNFLTSTVSQGKMHMEDLAGSMGKVLPTASSLHVPLDQVGAAIAALTSAGTPAARATTALNQTMLMLVKPSTAAQKAMESVGLSATQVGNTLTHQGLQQALEMITDAVGKKFPMGSAQYLQAIATIGGGTKSLTGILGTTGTNMSTFIANMKNIGDSTKAAGDKVMGWNQVQKDEKTQMDEAKASIQNAKIALGEGLLPAVTAITKAIANVLKPIAEWVAGHQKLAAIIIAAIAAFGTLVVVILSITKAISLVKDAWMALNATFLTNPITLAIMAIIALTILMITHWNDVKQWFDDFMKWFKTHWEDVVMAILPFTILPMLIISHWNTIKKWFDDFTGIIRSDAKAWANIFAQLWSDIEQWAGDAWHGIVAVWQAVIGFFQGIVNGVEAVFKGLFNFIVNGVKSIYNSWMSLASDIHNILGDIIHFITDGAKDFDKLLVQAGKDLINGLINGIKSSVGDVTNAVKDVGKGAIAAAKDVLKIFSPSQVFADIGTNVGLGFVQGIKGTQTQTTQAVNKLVTGSPIISNTNNTPIPVPVTNNNNVNNSSQAQTVNIQQLNLSLPNGMTMKQFFDGLNQDSLNASKGLSIVQGAY